MTVAVGVGVSVDVDVGNGVDVGVLVGDGMEMAVCVCATEAVPKTIVSIGIGAGLGAEGCDRSGTSHASKTRSATVQGISFFTKRIFIYTFPGILFDFERNSQVTKICFANPE